MADTSHHPVPAGSTEGDGINYRGIVWFTVMLVGTTLVCQALMWGLFAVFENNITSDPRAPMAAPQGQLPPGPNLLNMTEEKISGERADLLHVREAEHAVLTSYDWVDKNGKVVRIPLEEAKRLLLERGIPGGTNTPAKPAAGKSGPGGL